MTVHKPRDRWKGFVENVGLMVNRPAPLQFAALCYRLTKKRTEFLLITSRDTGRWIIPKGWAIKNKTEAESAAQEAFEEASRHSQVGSLLGMRSERWVGSSKLPAIGELRGVR